MYSEFTALPLLKSERSVLDRLSYSASVLVSAQIVEDLCHQLSSNQQPSFLNDDDLKWFMQVIDFSLGLTFSSDYPTIRYSVRLYCDWLSCVTNNPNKVLPRPLLDQPLFYASKIINHLLQLFAPRLESSTDTVLKQAKECHHVLRCLQTVTTNFHPGLRDSCWPMVLQFLLSIADSLLSPNLETDDISDQLCDRVLDVLFELWFLASSDGHFPSPAYWKTFKQLYSRWNHRFQVVDHWIRACVQLTARQLRHMYDDHYCRMILNDEGSSLLPENMSPTIVYQTWLRVLKLIDEPVKFLRSMFPCHEITKPTEVSSISDSHLQHYSMTCHWQYSFYRMMRGIYCLISGLLGETIDCTFKEPEKALKDVNSSLNQFLTGQQPAGAPVQQSVSLIKAAMSFGSSTRGKMKAAQPSKTTITINHLSDSVMISAILKSLPLSSKMSDYLVNKPLAETLCKLFSGWLFDIADSKIQNLEQRKYPSFENDTMSQKSQGSQQSSDVENAPTTRNPTNVQNDIRNFLESLPSVNGYQAGKAEAIAALCKIFSSKSCQEDLPENTLCRFYSVLSDVLCENDTIITSYIVVHSIDLFRVNLRGSELLVPYFLDCLDALCIEPDGTKIHPSLSVVYLRSACLKILSSLVSLPTFYGNQKLSDINTDADKITFISMRSKILRVILHELKIETDSQNLQLCLCITSVFCYSSYLWEEDNKQLLGQQSPSESAHYFDEIMRLCLPTVWDSLCGKWSSDYAVCLAAIDYFCFLSGFLSEKVHEYIHNVGDIVLHLCTFIEIQLSKPPPAHSRDLHSTVVGAYYCLETLLTNSLDVLQAEHCLQKVCDVVQLGMTGLKAASPSTNDFDIQTDKKPASQRVFEAAEQLFHTLFNRIPSVPKVAQRPQGENVQPMVFERLDYFPIEINRAEKLAIDNGFPIELGNAPEIARLTKLVKNCNKSTPNQKSHQRPDQDRKPNGFMEAVNGSKLFLYSLGYLDPTDDQMKCQKLDSNLPNFRSDMASIVDNCPPRSIHTVHIFYVSKSKTSPVEILQNGIDLEFTSLHFRTMLSDLGVGIDVQSGHQWSGHFSTSFYNTGPPDHPDESENNGYLLDGISNALYFATPLIEMAILVPTIRSYKLANRNRAQSSPRDIIRRKIRHLTDVKDLKQESARFCTSTESSSEKNEELNNIMNYTEDDSCFNNGNVIKRSVLEG